MSSLIFLSFYERNHFMIEPHIYIWIGVDFNENFINIYQVINHRNQLFLTVLNHEIS